MNIAKDIEVQQGEGYIVERDSDGAAMGCIYVGNRRQWNTIKTGAFFAYEIDATVRGVAEQCADCGEWVLYLMSGKCAECLEPALWGMTGEDEAEQRVRY